MIPTDANKLVWLATTVYTKQWRKKGIQGGWRQHCVCKHRGENTLRVDTSSSCQKPNDNLFVRVDDDLRRRTLLVVRRQMILEKRQECVARTLVDRSMVRTASIQMQEGETRRGRNETIEPRENPPGEHFRWIERETTRTNRKIA